MRYFKVNVNGTLYEIQLEEVSAEEIKNAPAQPVQKAAQPVVSNASSSDEEIKCPMAGTISTVNVTVGKDVKRGDVLMILEAMKMENEICAPRDGKITSVCVSGGNTVESGAVLCTLA